MYVGDQYKIFTIEVKREKWYRNLQSLESFATAIIPIGREISFLNQTTSSPVYLLALITACRTQSVQKM